MLQTMSIYGETNICLFVCCFFAIMPICEYGFLTKIFIVFFLMET